MASEVALDLDPRRARVGFVLVCALALVLRVVYVLQARSSPLFDHPQMDALYHVEWARAFARGEDFQPGPFFRAPLYPWFLGLCTRFFGEDLLLPRLVQAGFGTLTVALVMRVAALVFDRRTALVAGLVAATYWTSIYFEGELLLPVLEMLFDLAAIERTLVAGRDGRIRSWCVAGAAWGAATLVRPNVLAFVPLMVLWSLRGPERFGLRAVRAAAFVLGLAALIAPVTLYNRIVGHDAVLVSSQGGVNFWIGNNPSSDGSSAIVPGTRGDWWGGYHDAIAIAESARGRALAPSEVSAFYTERALTWMRTEPMAALRHFVWKARLFWMDWELGNNVDERFFALRYGPILRWLPVGFGALAAAGIVGLLLAWRRSWTCAPLLLFVPVYAGTVIAFFVCARFRMPIVPVLAVFAGSAVVHAWDAWRSARRQLAVAIATAIAAAGVLLHRVPDSVDRTGAQGWWLLGSLALERGEFVEAANCFAAARDARPSLALAHEGLGLALLGLGREAEAAASLRRAVELDPHLAARAADRLLELAIARGDDAGALALARRTGADFPYSARGPYDESRVHFAAYERAQAHGDAAAASQALERAEAALARAANLPLDDDLSFAVPFSSGKVALLRRRFEAARAAFEQALAARPNLDAEGWMLEAVRGLVTALRGLGRNDEALARLHALLLPLREDARARDLERELSGER